MFCKKDKMPGRIKKDAMSSALSMDLAEKNATLGPKCTESSCPFSLVIIFDRNAEARRGLPCSKA